MMGYIYVVTRDDSFGSDGVFTDIKVADAYVRSMGYVFSYEDEYTYQYVRDGEMACISKEHLDTSTRDDWMEL